VIVVSDTSSINYLTLMGLHELLPALFGEVVIPPTVAREPAAGATIHPAIGATLKSEWLLVRNLVGTGLPEDARNSLDPDEAEAIALAIEMQATLLIDDLDGRHYAMSMKLPVIGTLGVLAMARRTSIVGPIAPLIDRLTGDLGFRASPRIISSVLRFAGE
jgi:predicted nucleic acid-binding protein